MGKYWDFAEIRQIEECAFNKYLKEFVKYGLDGLVRENIQNSLDGKLEGSDQPVEVYINIGRMKSSEVPGINELKEHAQSLQGGNQYTRDKVKLLQKKINQNDIYYISFEDRNTKGLTGAIHGSDFNPDRDSWGAYAYRKGMHHFENDDGKESARGGSHGIGKIASNAASDINVMFFSNCDELGNQHIGGTAQFIEHTIFNKCFRETGYFTQVMGEIYYPFSNTFDKVFEKNTRGLKIVIPYLKEEYRDIKQVVRSVCDNFFRAILDEKLVVYVDGLEISSSNILNILKDDDYYEEQDVSQIKKNFTTLYVDTFLNGDMYPIDIPSNNRNYKFKIYIRYIENLKKGRTAIIRSNGMKIEDFKVRNFATAPYNAVLIPASNEEDKFLKTLENESHTALSEAHIEEVESKKNAKAFIVNISKIIGEIISEIIKQNNESDGIIDTSDIIYELETAFKNSLSSTTSSVRLTKKGSGSDVEIMKIKAKKRKKTKKKKDPVKDVIKRIKNRRSRKKEGTGENVNRKRYTMHPDTVRRIVLKDKEILSFDFNEISEYDDESTCNVGFLLIDGQGKELDEQFIVGDNYISILDKNTSQTCRCDGNIIENVSIEDGKINLQLTLSSGYNTNLKFSYLVEV